MDNKKLLITGKILLAILYIIVLFAVCILAAMAFLSLFGSKLLDVDFFTLFLSDGIFKGGLMLGIVFFLVVLDASI